jgi:hypothetical protein
VGSSSALDPKSGVEGSEKKPIRESHHASSSGRFNPGTRGGRPACRDPGFIECLACHALGLHRVLGADSKRGCVTPPSRFQGPELLTASGATTSRCRNAPSCTTRRTRVLHPTLTRSSMLDQVRRRTASKVGVQNYTSTSSARLWWHLTPSDPFISQAKPTTMMVAT